MGLGRNDLCHCGSGRKYKRCHVDEDRRARAATATALPELGPDLVSVSMAVQEGGIDDLEARVRAPTEPLHTDMLCRIGAGLDGADAALALRGYLQQLEDAMRPLAAKHSRLYWLHLSRRLAPTPIGNSRPWTVTLYRRILTLTALKHGTDAQLGEFTETAGEDGSRTIVPAVLDEQALVELRQLEHLAYEYNHAASAFRRIGKGAALRVVEDDLRAVAGDELQRRMVAFDERVARYGSLSGAYGAAVQTDVFSDPEHGTGFAAFGLTVNSDLRPPADLAEIAQARFTTTPNFVPVPLVLDHAREVLARFDNEMVAATGATPDALLATLCGLSMHTLKHLRESPRLAHQVFNVGYLVVSDGELWTGLCKNVADYLVVWFKHWREQEVAHADALTLVEGAFDALTYSLDDLQAIDLWTRSPYRLVLRHGGQHVIDLAAIGEVVSGLFEQVGSIPDDPGQIKGRGFEQEVIARGTSAGLTAWKTGVLKLTDGREREVDASFIVGDTLYLVECKAYAQSARVELGDYAGLKGRWERLDTSFLKQARTLAEFVQANPKGTNYEVPASIMHVEYCVCTPVPEWIASTERQHWLTDTVPRICTPDELLEVLVVSAGRGAATPSTPAR